MHTVQHILFIVSLVSLFSCNENEVITPNVDTTSKKYLHLSHTRTNSNPLMEPVAESLDYSKFDMLWLGGDLAHLTSADDVTMNRADSIFDIGNPNTLWALGNHDYTDLNKIQQYTNRPAYYTTQKNGITLVVLDSQDSLSNIVGNQKTFLMGILDTIQESTHLILLHHKLVWMYDNPTLQPQIASVSNGPLGSCFYCINPNNFNSDIYPELVNVKNRGVEVICLAGDLGFKVTEFAHTTPDGIHFLASGIENGNAGNKALLFSHDVANKSLSWEFKLLSDL